MYDKKQTHVGMVQHKAQFCPLNERVGISAFPMCHEWRTVPSGGTKWIKSYLWDYSQLLKFSWSSLVISFPQQMLQFLHLIRWASWRQNNKRELLESFWQDCSKEIWFPKKYPYCLHRPMGISPAMGSAANGNSLYYAFTVFTSHLPLWHSVPSHQLACKKTKNTLGTQITAKGRRMNGLGISKCLYFGSCSEAKSKGQTTGFLCRANEWFDELSRTLFLADIYENMISIKESRQEGTIAPYHKVLGISTLAASPGELVSVQENLDWLLLGDLWTLSPVPDGLVSVVHKLCIQRWKKKSLWTPHGVYYTGLQKHFLNCLCFFFF